MAAAAILKVHFNGHKSVGIAGIHIKFGSETKTDVPETEITPNFISAKIQDGGRPTFKNTPIVITRPPYEISRLVR